MGRIILTTTAMAAALFGCKSSTYYEAAETVGYEKREMLIDRLQEARDSQVGAKQQMQTALYTLRRIGSVPETELEDLHDDLATEVNRAKDQLDDLHDDIAAVESVARSLFDDWEDDLAKFENQEARNRSQEELRDTRKRHETLVAELRSSERKLQRIMPRLEDQARVLEHAEELGRSPSLTDDLDDVREEISTLIEELDDSIDRTQRFIDEGIEVAT
jgi:DNA repair exonuclease SbcCD ATPase subunit